MPCRMMTVLRLSQCSTSTPAGRARSRVGRVAGETDQTQVKGATGEAIGKVGLGGVVHPRTDDGDELSSQEKIEVARGQGGEAGE